MKTLKILSERTLPALFWILLMLAFDTPAMTIATLMAAALHEIGHIAVMAHLSRGKLSLPRTVMFGLRLRENRLLSYKEEAFLALGGPLANIIAFIILIPLFDLCDGYFFIFAFLNLLTAISNLIPIKGYDGYKIIECLLAPKMGIDKCARIISSISFLFSTVAVFASLFLIMKIGEGYWIFAVFFAILIKDILKMQNRINLEITGDFKRF